MAADLLLDGRLRDRGIFEPSEVSRLWREHRSRHANHEHRLWQLLMLELWFREFIDKRPTLGSAASTDAGPADAAPVSMIA